MDKVLVEVFVPAIDTSYDMFIPQTSPAYEVLELMKKAVAEISDNRFTADNTVVLCNRSDGTIINLNMSIYELGIRNGSKLMLI